jgi:multiple sugar transport system ATP-binding protein
LARVELENISKVYPGGVRAVDGVSLRIEDRELVVLVGPSGCGKSTTLRMVAGLEETSAGVIRIGDRVVNDVPPKNRDIAMVFQNYALYPHMSVYKNMAFGLELRMLPGLLGRIARPRRTRELRRQIDQRVQAAAKILDLEDLMDRKPRQLSGGQRQRVAVGRAIVREPAAFLFDEPLSNLDAKLRVTTRAELKRLHQRLKTTTIYVTHDQEEAMTLGDRIVVMKNGKIQQADTPLRTYNHPVNRFVAGFIGMPPMNFFAGAIRETGSGLVFEEARLDGGRPAGLDGERLTEAGSGFRLVVPPHLAKAVERWAGRPVVLGIRPEHLHLRPVDGDGNGSELLVKINVIEPLGSDMDLYMDTALHDHVVARVEAGAGDGGGLQIGAQVKLYADLRKIHFFEPGETGMNLSLQDTAPSGASPTNEPAHATA